MDYIIFDRYTGDTLYTVSGDSLSGADLSHADLSNAHLRDADLSHADLSHADLSHANLRVANLSNADLSNARLRGADLRGADLTSANLSYADLRDADLRGADLSFNRTIVSCGAGAYVMYIHRGPEGLMIKSGCRYYTVEEAREHWSPENILGWTVASLEYGERQLRMVDFLETEAILLSL